MNRYLYYCPLCNANLTSKKCWKCGRSATIKTPLDEISERDFSRDLSRILKKHPNMREQYSDYFSATRRAFNV